MTWSEDLYFFGEEEPKRCLSRFSQDTINLIGTLGGVTRQLASDTGLECYIYAAPDPFDIQSLNDTIRSRPGSRRRPCYEDLPHYVYLNLGVFTLFKVSLDKIENVNRTTVLLREIGLRLKESGDYMCFLHCPCHTDKLKSMLPFVTPTYTFDDELDAVEFNEVVRESIKERLCSKIKSYWSEPLKSTHLRNLIKLLRSKGFNTYDSVIPLIKDTLYSVSGGASSSEAQCIRHLMSFSEVQDYNANSFLNDFGR